MAVARQNTRRPLARPQNYCESKQTYFSYSLDKAFHSPEFQAKLFFTRNWVGGFYWDSLLKKLRHIVNSEIRLAKQAYYQNSFNQYTGDSRKTWQTISEPTSRKSGKTAVTSLKVNGVSITNPTELSKEFNNHFATIGPELSCDIDSPGGDGYQRCITSTDQCFQLRPTSVDKVFFTFE